MRACQACVSYSLIMRVFSRITLVVVVLRIKVIVKRITLHNHTVAEKFENVPIESDEYLLYDITTTDVKIAWTHGNGK